MCGTVGPVGYSLGGGHGPLIRSYGLGSDNIESLDLVNAKGEFLSGVTSENNPDLFWALAGGGGGTFGIVTSIELKAHPAPAQLTSLVCNWPLTEGNTTVGIDALGTYFDDIMPNLINEWGFFSLVLKVRLIDEWEKSC